MTPIKDTDYLAVSAWLHAMETRLLTPEKVERLLEAASETEARKLLTECGYAEALPLEEALREHRETLYKELAAAVPDPRLIELFQLKYDYHNIKAILKAERRGISPEAFLLPGGRYDAAQLQSEWQQEHMFQVSDTARRTPFGEETVLCYLAAVENEITAIRIIMTGRQAGLSPEMIRSRLRNAG